MISKTIERIRQGRSNREAVIEAAVIEAAKEADISLDAADALLKAMMFLLGTDDDQALADRIAGLMLVHLEDELYRAANLRAAYQAREAIFFGSNQAEDARG